MNGTKTQNRPKMPGWLNPVIRMVMALNCLVLAVGTQHILSIPGRKFGKLWSTPVSLLTVGGQRYICTVSETDWVKNARAAGWGYLARGRKREQVALIELPVEQRGRVLREFPIQVPHGVQFFQMTLGLPPDPEAFAAAAPQCPVFRVDSLPAADQR